MKYPCIVYPASEGGYVAEIPALKGCLARGETLNETLAKLKTVERLWLESAESAGVEVPKIITELTWVREKLAA